MNSQNLQLIIIVLLLVILALILGLGLVAFFHFTKKKNSKPSNSTQQLTPKKSSIAEGGFCEEHPGRPSVGICNICEKECCVDCLKDYNGLHLCPSHFKEVLENEWIPITNERTTAQNPEKGIYIYEFKRNLWEKSQISTYIQSHYKIHVENDEVETYVQLHVKKSQEEQLKEKIDQYKESKQWRNH